MEQMGDLRSELLAIREKRGILTPTVVVEEASDPEHPLHSKFTWDNDEAARRWRLHEAGNLLRVTFRADLGGRPADLRAFWVMPRQDGEKGNERVPIEEIATNPVSQKIMLQSMRRDWQRFKNRYESHQQFFEVITEDWPEDWPPLEPPEANGSEG